MDDSEKLDKILEKVHEMSPVLQRVEVDVKDLKNAVRTSEINDAQQDVHLGVLKEDINNVGRKVRTHEANHWKFVSVVLAVLGVIGFAMKLSH